MSRADFNLPSSDILLERHKKCLDMLKKDMPEAKGLLLFGRINIYYLSRTLCNGVFWLPLEGQPILFVRKSLARAKLESPVTVILPFRSYGEVAEQITRAHAKIPPIIACDKKNISWALSELLTQRFPQIIFQAADSTLAQVRALKDKHELHAMRISGEKLHAAVTQLLPPRLKKNMTEYEISSQLSECFFSLGQLGPLRMSAFGEEGFLGHIAVGDNGNYPSHFNGPLGLLGAHPSAPFMGSPTTHWRAKSLLSIDTYFSNQGYLTDKTQVFFCGAKQQLPELVKKAHEVCLEIEQMAAQMLKPGAIPAQIYAAALKFAGEKGFTEEFMGLGENQVPFLGHGIGLTVDEWPVLAKQFHEPIEETMTLAIEPKIGLPGLGMVGSENTYEVTASGAHSLTGPPQEIICLE